MSTQLERLYSTTGRPPIPPEQLLRALLRQVPYRTHGERLPMEELDYNLLLRWFVKLTMDDPVWQPTTFKETGTGCWTARLRRPSSTRSVVGLCGGSALRRAFTLDGTQLGAGAIWKVLPSAQRVGRAAPPGRRGERDGQPPRRAVQRHAPSRPPTGSVPCPNS